MLPILTIIPSGITYRSQSLNRYEDGYIQNSDMYPPLRMYPSQRIQWNFLITKGREAISHDVYYALFLTIAVMKKSFFTVALLS